MTTRQFSNLWAWRRSLTGIALAAGLLSWGAVSVFALPITPYAWYRADAGVLTSGTNVTEWQDQSGNNRHLNGTDTDKSISGAPQVSNTGPLGQQVIRLDGDDHFSALPSSNWGAAARGWVFAVWQRTGGDGQVYGGADNNGRQDLAYQVEEGVPSLLALSSLPFQAGFVSDPVGQNAWAYTGVDYFKSAGGIERLRVNGVGHILNNGAALDSGGMEGIKVGTNKPGNFDWTGDIAELIVFEGDLSSSQVLEIETELNNRWLVPEPSTLGMLFVGLLGLSLRARRNRR